MNEILNTKIENEQLRAYIGELEQQLQQLKGGNHFGEFNQNQISMNQINENQLDQSTILCVNCSLLKSQLENQQKYFQEQNLKVEASYNLIKKMENEIDSNDKMILKVKDEICKVAQIFEKKQIQSD